MSQHTATRQKLISWLDGRVDVALTIDMTAMAETITLARTGASPAQQAELELLSERLLARVTALLDKASPEIALDGAKTLALLAGPGQHEPAQAPVHLTAVAAA